MINRELTDDEIAARIFVFVLFIYFGGCLFGWWLS